MDYEELRSLIDYKALNEFRMRSLNPERPVTRGTAENGDIFFQAAEASNKYYEDIVGIVADYMKEISRITGREYKPFDYYGDPEAERIIVAMGSVTDTIEETVDYLRDKGEKVGVIKVRLYRPFSKEYFFNVLPKTVKKIAVLDRTKEKGATAEPLHLDVLQVFYRNEHQPIIVGGRYGLSSKDTTPTMIKAVFDNLKQSTQNLKEQSDVNSGDSAQTVQSVLINQLSKLSETTVIYMHKVISHTTQRNQAV